VHCALVANQRLAHLETRREVHGPRDDLVVVRTAQQSGLRAGTERVKTMDKGTKDGCSPVTNARQLPHFPLMARQAMGHLARERVESVNLETNTISQGRREGSGRK
jgi:hypothetical protein